MIFLDKLAARLTLNDFRLHSYSALTPDHVRACLAKDEVAILPDRTAASNSKLMKI